MASMSQVWSQLLHGLGSLLAFLYDIVPSYGLAIVLLTIVVRLAMVPLTIKQNRSMQDMAKLQPELQKLRAKYKGERQKLNEETMKLFQEHGYNPYGGCLPTLLQFPVFFALYQVIGLPSCGKTILKGKKKVCAAGYLGTKFLPHASALRKAIIAGNASFLGMNLSKGPLTAYKDAGLVHAIPYFVLVLLMFATTFFQQKQMTSIQNQSGAAPQAQAMLKVMPVMLGVFSLQFPVALTIYWVTSNIWTIVQQYLLMGRQKERSPRRPWFFGRGDGQESAPETGDLGPPPKPKGSGARRGKRRRK